MSFGRENPQGSSRCRCNTWPGIKEETSPSPKPSRLNVWGNHSYADLITRAITSSPQQRLTLTQIYDWLIENVPYFRHKSDKASSAGWKNSIRHNLSLHSKFMKVQNEVAGKSSWWMINYQVKDTPGRRRCATMDHTKMERKKQNARIREETIRKIKEESITNFHCYHNNSAPQMMEVQAPVQPSTSYQGNTYNTVQADQNYNHMVATFQYGMTLYYPSPSDSHTNNYSIPGVPFMNNVTVPSSSPGFVQSQNTTNLEDLDLNPIRLPYEIDIEGIIRKELEIDGRLDFI